MCSAGNSHLSLLELLGGKLCFCEQGALLFVFPNKNNGSSPLIICPILLLSPIILLHLSGFRFRLSLRFQFLNGNTEPDPSEIYTIF